MTVTTLLAIVSQVQFGPLADVRLLKDGVTGAPRGIAFADYADMPSAIYAAHALHGLRVDGRELRVNMARAERDAPLPPLPPPLAGAGPLQPPTARARTWPQRGGTRSRSRSRSHGADRRRRRSRSRSYSRSRSRGGCHRDDRRRFSEADSPRRRSRSFSRSRSRGRGARGGDTRGGDMRGSNMHGSDMRGSDMRAPPDREPREPYHQDLRRLPPPAAERRVSYTGSERSHDSYSSHYGAPPGRSRDLSGFGHEYSGGSTGNREKCPW